MDETIVIEWLRSLSAEQYAESFIDNGYDDLEICKQIDAPDLDAIGVVDASDRAKILEAVWTLKVEGAASVYFTIEEAQAAAGDATHRPLSSSSNENASKKIRPTSSLNEKHPDNSETKSDVDAYEAGKAELIRFPQIQLRKFIQDELQKDNINLTVHPYSSNIGERGILEGLASRYADILNTHYQDVLEHLEFIRSIEWNKFISSRLSEDQHEIGRPTSETGSTETNSERLACQMSSPLLIENNEDCPIYVPGKYNPSSCLSDAEEDQIYGYTKGTCPSSLPVNSSIPGYLNPRSQCIYELPPSQRNQTGTKRRLGIGRFLKTLKRDLRLSNDTKTRNSVNQTSHNISKSIGTTPDLTSTPLVVLPGYSSPTSSHCSQSSKSHSSGQSYLITSVSAPGTPGSSGPMRDSGLQEAIERLKEEEIHRRREKQFREHEQILEDIRNGLKLTKNLKGFGSSLYTKFPAPASSSYVYDNEALDISGRKKRAMESGRPLPLLPHHWYDEPPYESDPEDFLINTGCIKTRECASNSLRHSIDEDVISLKTAGDISIPRDVVYSQSIDPKISGSLCDCADPTQPLSPTHCHNQTLLPNKPPAEDQRNYLKMDILRPSSRSELAEHETQNSERKVLNCNEYSSLMKMEPSGNTVNEQCANPKLSSITLQTYQLGKWGASKEKTLDSRIEDDISGRRFSSSLNNVEDKERKDSESLVGRMKMLQRDMQKKISCLRNSRTNSSLQRSGPHLGPELRERLTGGNPQFIQRQNSLPVKFRQCRARALVDCRPSAYDQNALVFKKGNIIDIISKNPNGIWQGHINGKYGYFKSFLVEELEPVAHLTSDRPAKRYGITHDNSTNVLWLDPFRDELMEVLIRFDLTHLSQLFFMNGFKSIGHFMELRPKDLNQLGILEPELQLRVMRAVHFIQNSVRQMESQGHVRNITLIGYPNGRSRLPLRGSHQEIPSLTAQYHNDQIYENTSRLICFSPENNFDVLADNSVRSSSSTDTSSGYHSRPNFNIPIVTTADPLIRVPSQSSSPSTPTCRNEDNSSTLSSSHSSPKRSQTMNNPTGTEDSYRARIAYIQSPSSSSPPSVTETESQ